jgi:hypothetical protein
VFFLLPVIWLLAGLVCFATPKSPAPAELQQAEAIDFDTLRAQAAVALETLQQSRERQLAFVAHTTL